MSIQYIPQGVPVVSSSFSVSGSYTLKSDWNTGTASLAGHGLNAVGVKGSQYAQVTALSPLVNTGSQGLTLLVVATGSTGFKMATSSFSTDYEGGYVGPIAGENPTLNLVSGSTYRFLIRGQPPTLVQSTFRVSGTSVPNHYYFDIGALGDDPPLTLIRGYRYEFNINVPGHPFWLQSSAGAYNPSNVLTSATGVYNNGTSNGRISFIVPYNLSSPIYYVSQNNSSMSGTITLVDDGQYRFRIQSSPGQSGTIYNVGVTNNNITSGSLTFTVGASVGTTLYYASPDTANMNGTINVIG